MEELYPEELRRLLGMAEEVALRVVLPAADTIDREARWPHEGLAALAEAGLWGLTAPRRVGGHGFGLLATSAVTQVLGRACASTAMCFGMHCVATAVIAAKATPDQDRRYLEPIAAGRHLTTLALSEEGTGSNFYIPQTRLRHDGADYVVHGTKQFVTNGHHADSYVVSTVSSAGPETGEFNCLVVDRDLPGLAWQEGWRGMGMRGNASETLHLRDVRVPAANLLGAEGDQLWYVFEVVAPFFLMAMAGTYVGVARAALEYCIQHLKSRRLAHTGASLSGIETNQYRVGQLWTTVERASLMVTRAGLLGDQGSAHALGFILAAKAEAADAAVQVCNEAMTLCGGSAYRENATLARLLRDARASHVMSPTTDILRLWTGRHALGLPLL